MANFWSKLNKPIYALAPMAGVADSAFRQICKSYGADVVYSEMASVAGLVFNPKKTLELLKFSKKERPYIVQLFGSKPEQFARAVRIVEKEIKPDGIDINFGCPVKKVARQGAGAVLMKDLKLAHEVIKTTINNTKLPVSIKIRSQVGDLTCLKFLKVMADLDIKAVMIHGRSMTQGNSGEVDFKIIKKARKYVKGILLANGGVKDRESAKKLLKITGADGIGIGQGALGRPWIFSDHITHNAQCITRNPAYNDSKFIFKIMLKHAKLVEKLSAQGGSSPKLTQSASGRKGKQGIMEMRKHLCWYVSGMPNAGSLREKLVKVKNLKDIKEILK